MCGTLNFTFPPVVDLGHRCSQIISRMAMGKRSLRWLVTNLRCPHALLYVTI